ncbi:hypothetical protein OG558_30075 [Kribbella sp. NBC_01510]|uniref:hypothetical protein n=1 Tax=Kribbella sp. NBC_01510 TaxID=2903581 RepID=UPI00386403FF
MRSPLVEYVDKQTPDEAPPFEYVEQAVRERRRRKYVVSAAVAAVVVVAGIIAGIGVPRALREPVTPEPTPTVPAPTALDDGPPPQQFRIGSIRLLLRGEIAVTAVTPDPDASVLIVNVAPDEIAIEPCAPNTIVRILSQDDQSIRVAAYRYGVGPDQNEGHLCAQRSRAPTTLRIRLRSPLDGRTVYAGSTGQRVVLRP